MRVTIENRLPQRPMAIVLRKSYFENVLLHFASSSAGGGNA